MYQYVDKSHLRANYSLTYVVISLTCPTITNGKEVVNNISQ